MKTTSGGAAPPLFSPPAENWREDVMQRHAAPAIDLFQLRTHQARETDRRPGWAPWSGPRRIHARQMEPRSAVDCHVRLRRRAHTDGG